MSNASPADGRPGAEDSIAASHPPRRRTRRRTICRIACTVAAVAVLVIAVALIFPEAVPTVIQAMRDNPLAPVLVAGCWMVATAASIVGKRAISRGHLCWATTTTSHIGGTVANRVLPGGVGAAGAFIAALRRRGASTTIAVGVVTLWAVAGALGHAGALLLSLAWLWDGWESLLAILAAMVLLVIAGPTLARRIRAAGRRSGGRRPPRSARPPRPTRPPSRWRAVRAIRAVRTRAGQLAAAAREVVSAARARPMVAAAAVATQTISLLCFAVGFALAVIAFGLPVPFVTAVAVYFAGSALSAATPTPAGIGSAEAALVGSLVVAGATVGEALPAVLLFRAMVLLVPVLAAALIATAWLALGWATRLGRPGRAPMRSLSELWASEPART